MVKNVELFRALSDYIEDAVVESCKIIMDAGVDFLWFPTPNFGGYLFQEKHTKNAFQKATSAH